ncbi:MAG: Spy/CpxP family protein refolding chaperone [Candidatus Helarchaeota archaeon]|nr:Spy/CpxP family protein refolding chaperone [Candidatus Helarchaeota archaeon]
MKRLSLISVLLIFLFSSIAFAQMEKPLLPEKNPVLKAYGPQRFLERIISRRLDLTEEQKNKLKELNDNWRKEREGVVKDLRKAREELSELMKEKSPNERDVNRKVEQINSIKSELFKKETGISLERRKIFTDEQWEKIQNARKFGVRRKLWLKRRAPRIFRHRGSFLFGRDFFPHGRYFDRGFDHMRRDWKNRSQFMRERFREFFDFHGFREPPIPERK